MRQRMISLSPPVFDVIHSGLYYKRGLHGFMFLWSNGEWARSSKSANTIYKDYKLVDGVWVLKNPPPPPKPPKVKAERKRKSRAKVGPKPKPKRKAKVKAKRKSRAKIRSAKT